MMAISSNEHSNHTPNKISKDTDHSNNIAVAASSTSSNTSSETHSTFRTSVRDATKGKSSFTSDGLPWEMNITNMADVERLESMVHGSDSQDFNSNETDSSRLALDLFNTYTNFMTKDKKSISNRNGTDQLLSNMDILGTSTDMDILQGGYANTANPPVDVDATTNAEPNGSSVSLSHAPEMGKSGSRSTTIAAEEYTPLISPAIPPLERVSSAGRSRKPGFSPLTSPALDFQYNHGGSSSSLRQKRKDDQAEISSSPEAGDGYGRYNGSYKRSKTPSSTPLITPVGSSNGINSSRIPSSAYAFSKSKFMHRHRAGRHSSPNTINSSNFGSRRNSQQSIKSNQESAVFEPLPDEMMLPPSGSQHSRKSSKTTATANTGSFLGRSTSLKITQSSSTSGDGPAATPATLMSFPISSDHSARNSPRLLASDNVFVNPNHNMNSAQSSPVILPSSSSTILQQQQQQEQLKRVNSKVSIASTTNSVRPSPRIDPQQRTHIRHLSDTGSRPRRRSSSSLRSTSKKKINHKLAEQGRRNRMNVAIQELDGLIPSSMKDASMVPSKATTVELSSKYIRILQDDNLKMKQELERLTSELDRYSKTSSVGESRSSISPLEYIDTEAGKE